MSIRALLRRFREKPRGQSFVEFALILPVFLVILSAAVDLGRIAYARVTIANVAREASFQAAQTPTSYQAGQECVSGSEDDNQVICRAILESTGSVITVAPADITLSCSTTCAETMGSLVTVTVTGRFNLLTPVMAVFFGGSTITLSSTATNQIASLPSNDAAQPPPPVTTIVPASLIGMTVDELLAALAAESLTAGTRTDAFDSTYAAGLIISVTPSAGTSVTVGSVVDYVVSKGPAPTVDCSTVSAGFTYTEWSSTGGSPVTVTVTDTTTYNPGCFTVWDWFWGDGGTTLGDRTPDSHVYLNPGPENKNFKLTLRVTSGAYETTVGGYTIQVKP